MMVSQFKHKRLTGTVTIDELMMLCNPVEINMSLFYLHYYTVVVQLDHCSSRKK